MELTLHTCLVDIKFNVSMAYNQSGLSFIPPSLRIIIVINVVCFVLQAAIPGMTEWGALHYWTSSLFRPHQIVTTMFLHGGFAHIFFNMYSLWIFGAILENFWGSKKFLNFYMICGIGAKHRYPVICSLYGRAICKNITGSLAGQYRTGCY